jgi:hypothetical protein
MASFTERIKVVLDVESTKIEHAFKTLRTNVSEADGFVNKFKAGATGAFQAAQQYAGQLAVAGGAALVAFGTKSVMAFQETALGAGHLRDALGVTAEEASRLQEVAGDLGIGVGALEKSIGRMNRSAADTPGEFDKIGAAISRNADGSTNTVETFKNVAEALRRIPDPAARAAAAQRILGRSWMDVSELIMSGSAGIADALAGVEGSKIIDDDEIEKARAFRDRMDALKDALEEVSLAAGETLVPALTGVADVLLGVKSAVDAIPDLPGWLKDGATWAFAPIAKTGELVDGVKSLGKSLFGDDDSLHAALDAARSNLNNLADDGNTAGIMLADLEAATKGSTEAIDLEDSALGSMIPTLEGTADGVNRLDEVQRRAKEAADMHREAIERQRDQVKRLIDANLQLVGGELAVQSAQNSAAEAVVRYTEVNADAEASELDKSNAQIAATESLLGAAQAAVDYRVKQAEANGQTLDAGAKAQLMRDELAKLAATMQPGSPLLAAILGYIQQLDQIPRSVTTELRVTGQQVTAGGDVIGVRVGARASGGPVSPGQSYVVGEEGPEVLTMGAQSGFVTPNDALRGSGGMPPVQITVNAQGAVGLSGPQVEQWVAEALTRWKRRNGER